MGMLDGIIVFPYFSSMESSGIWNLLSLLVWLFVMCGGANGNGVVDQFHPYTAYKEQPGWQEPGLWRPKWILDREFEDENGNVISRDRIYLKLRSDHTIKLYRSNNRPILEMFRKATEKKQKTKVFETGDEEVKSAREQVSDMAKERAQALDIDGTWSFADEGPLRAAKVTMDIWEGPEAERIRHEARCEWGRYIDPYAAKFQLGDISKFTGFTKDKDVPIGKHRVGSFIMRANVHRPLVGKDFQGFQ